MNYLSLLNMKYKAHGILLLVASIFLLLLINISSFECYDIYNTYGYVVDSKIIINQPLNYPDKTFDIDYIKVKDKEYHNVKYSISEILLDSNNLVNYQEITLMIPEKFLDNEVLKVTIYHNKERIIKKIQKILF